MLPQQQPLFKARWSTYRDKTGPVVAAEDTQERLPRVGDWVTLVSRKKR